MRLRAGYRLNRDPRRHLFPVVVACVLVVARLGGFSHPASMPPESTTTTPSPSRSMTSCKLMNYSLYANEYRDCFERTFGRFTQKRLP
ncbi:hypothetical protein B0H11DRAFT_1985404 [Mycena galericulata]|nr:hypothetical protein B0H11DRAFT_1985404 [Mycena galericulata]